MFRILYLLYCFVIPGLATPAVRQARGGAEKEIVLAPLAIGVRVSSG
jgi:hypothetical protein